MIAFTTLASVNQGTIVATLALDQLSELLPMCPGPAALPIASPTDGFGYVDEILTSFVAPDLADRPDAVVQAQPRIIVVSAAGAVGKSTLAREIARDRRAPLWDLAVAGPIAHHSLPGMLQRGFGVGALAQVHRLLASHQLVLVIDALDEARVKATDAGFEAFVRDASALAEAGAGVSLVLLGRTQIAETTWLILEDTGVHCRLLTIEPFSREQANEYIERRVRSAGGRGADTLETHPAPFAKARDLVFRHLDRAIAEEGQPLAGAAQQFLGYAPVLDAISVLLAGESNLNQMARDLEVGLEGADATHTAVLEGVVKRVLTREQGEKLVRNLRPVLAPIAAASGWTDWDFLYRPQEQCVRLVAKILGVDSGLTFGMPAQLLRHYEEAVAAFLPEHAFLKDGRTPVNTVFESYLFAYCLLSGTRAIAAAVEARLSSASYKPSRLFADFYFHLKPAAESIPAEHVGWLFEALLSAETESSHVSLVLDGPEPSAVDAAPPQAEVEGEFGWHALQEDSTWRLVRNVEFRVTVNPATPIRFRRYIRRATITVPAPVELGNQSEEFEVGPSVSICCTEFSVLAGRLIVGARDRAGRASGDADDAVIFEALKYAGSLASRPIARAALVVNWPGAERFPWTEFRGLRAPEVARDPRLHACYRRFRRILMSLQSHSRGGLARTRRKIENERMMQGPLGWALLAAMTADGMLRLEDGFYHWIPEVADGLVGTSWQDLRRGEAGPVLAGYLRAFAAANATLFPKV